MTYTLVFELQPKTTTQRNVRFDYSKDNSDTPLLHKRKRLEPWYCTLCKMIKNKHITFYLWTPIINAKGLEKQRHNVKNSRWLVDHICHNQKWKIKENTTGYTNIWTLPSNSLYTLQSSFARVCASTLSFNFIQLSEFYFVTYYSIIYNTKL